MTAHDLRDRGSETISITDRIKGWGKWALAAVRLGTAAEGGDAVNVSMLTSVKMFFNEWGVDIGTLVIVVGVWYLAHRLEQHRVNEARIGKNPCSGSPSSSPACSAGSSRRCLPAWSWQDRRTPLMFTALVFLCFAAGAGAECMPQRADLVVRTATPFASEDVCLAATLRLVETRLPLADGDAFLIACVPTGRGA